MNTITQQEKELLQSMSDQISRAAQVLNKHDNENLQLGTSIQSIMDAVRFINRAIAIESSKNINQLPNFELSDCRNALHLGDAP